MDFEGAIDELYTAPLDRFVDLRKELSQRAKEAGDWQLSILVLPLRKPTVAAWAINHAVRSDPSDLSEFLRFAQDMRDAQTALDGDAMRALSAEREGVLSRVEARVREHAAEAGQPLSAAVLEEVRASLIAAIADPRAQEALVCGCLTKPLSYAGLGEVDVRQSVAANSAISAPPRPPKAPPPGLRDASEKRRKTRGRGKNRGKAAAKAEQPAPPPVEEPVDPSVPEPSMAARARRREREEARRKQIEAVRDRLTAAERDVTAAELEVAEAEQAAQRAQARVAELERLLERTRDDARRAREACGEAERERDRAGAARDEVRAELSALEP